MKTNKFNIKFISVTLAVIMICTLLSGITVSADHEPYPINDENVLLNEGCVDSDAEADYSLPLWKQTNYFWQGNRGDTAVNLKGETRPLAQNQYAMQTNAAVLWYARDDFAWMYKQYPLTNNKNDTAIFQTTIDVDSITGKGGGGVTGAASVGIQLRSSLDEDSAFFWLNVRSKGTVHMIYRTEKGKMAQEKQTWLPCQSGKVTLYLKKVGAKVYYVFQRFDTIGKKLDQDIRWASSGIAINSVATNDPWYFGVGAHSSDENNPIYFEFSDYKVEGQYTVLEGDSAGGNDEPEEVIIPDPAPSADTIFMDTFSDKTLTGGTISATNPKWATNLGADPVFKNLDGNVVWSLADEPKAQFVGGTKLTDYTVGFDFKFDKANLMINTDPTVYTNNLSFYVRHKGHKIYGHRSAFVLIQPYSKPKMSGGQPAQDENGNPIYETTATKISLKFELDSEDNTAGSLGVERSSITLPYDISQDETWHHIEIKCFDNVFTVYFDDTEIIQYEQMTEGILAAKNQFPAVTGEVGVAVGESAVLIDNVHCRKLQDDFGGDYDNQIQGAWYRPVPQYIQEWQAKGLPIF